MTKNLRTTSCRPDNLVPYYQDECATIYHGDCRAILPQLPRADLVLTDPPYGIGEARGRNKGRSVLAVSKDYGVSSWDDAPPDADTLSAVINSAKWSIIFGGNFFDLPPSPCWLVWDKDNGATDFADCELAWTNFGCAARLIRHRWHGMLQEHGGQHKEARHHPTQKPVPVMQWCLQRAPSGVATVLDPFMGSGSTLVAAKLNGQRSIGIEREERYCEVAVSRLAQGVLDFCGNGKSKK